MQGEVYMRPIPFFHLCLEIFLPEIPHLPPHTHMFLLFSYEAIYLLPAVCPTGSLNAHYHNRPFPQDILHVQSSSHPLPNGQTWSTQCQQNEMVG